MRFILPMLFATLPWYSPMVAQADESAPKRWGGNVDVGYISSMGTSSGSKDTFRGKLALTRTGEYWINLWTAEGLGVRDEVPATRDPERYLLTYKARHFFNPRDFFTFRAQWEKDVLSGNEYQAFGSLGLGRDLVKTGRHYLKVEAGPGIRHGEGRRATDKNEGIGLFSWDYTWTFNENTRFIQKSSIESGATSTVTRINSQFRQNVTKVLALTVSHDYKHDNGDVNKREGLMSVGLNYQF